MGILEAKYSLLWLSGVRFGKFKNLISLTKNCTPLVRLTKFIAEFLTCKHLQIKQPKISQYLSMVQSKIYKSIFIKQLVNVIFCNLKVI